LAKVPFELSFQATDMSTSQLEHCGGRIWAAIKREALLLVKERVATLAEVDGIFKDVLKIPKGPCEQMDIVGLDVVLDIEEHYASREVGFRRSLEISSRKWSHRTG